MGLGYGDEGIFVKFIHYKFCTIKKLILIIYKFQ